MTSQSLEITDLAFGGKGVGRLPTGQVCFIPYALPGERVEIEVVRETKKFAEGRAERLLEASPRRVEPPCPYFGVCGGCAYQHASYDFQVEAKTRQVREVLRRLGGVQDPPVNEGIPSPLAYGYRNRITVHRRGGKIGFHRADGRGLVDIEACLLASDAVNAELAALRRERFREGARTLREHRDRRGFHQTNDEVAALLLQAVETVCSEGGGCLVDAYCGDGFFARQLAGRFQRVIGLEWNPQSIEQARRLAGPNESYVEGDVAENLESVLAVENDITLLLDPPAQGIDARALDSLVGRSIRRIVYVSCNPATLARDLQRLSPSYVLKSVTPFDMFPQTAEIEVVAELLPR